MVDLCQLLLRVEVFLQTSKEFRLCSVQSIVTHTDRAVVQCSTETDVLHL